MLWQMGYTDLHLTPADDLAGTLFVKNGYLSHPELLSLYEVTGWTVDNWPDEETICYRTSQALVLDLNLSPEIYIGAVPYGQNWLVLLNGVGNTSEEAVIVDRIRWRVRACSCNRKTTP